MAITYPTSPPFKAINLRMNDPSIVSRAQNGRRIARKVSGHYWMLTLTYPPKKREDFAPVIGAVAAAQGQFQTFTVVPPNLATPQGTQTSDTVVAASASAGATSVDLSGAGASATFKVGDVLKFSNHSKVYMLTSDSTADGGGLATLTFNPPLVSAVTITTTTIKHSNVPFNVALTGGIQEISTNVSGFYSFELDVEEDFG